MISRIVPYIRAQMKALKYTEMDLPAFSPQEIQKKSDLLFHIELGSGSASSDMQSIKMQTPVTLRVLFDGGAKPSVNGRDRAAKACDEIINQLCAPTSRNTEPMIKTLLLTAHEIGALDSTNQAVQVLTLSFNAITFLAPKI